MRTFVTRKLATYLQGSLHALGFSSKCNIKQATKMPGVDRIKFVAQRNSIQVIFLYVSQFGLVKHLT